MQWIYRALTDIIKRAFLEAITAANETGPIGYLTEDKAREMFGVSAETWRGWVDGGLIRPYPIGGVDFFKIVDLEKLGG